ncbi:MAG: ABC transporter ATP-binding protein [Lentisphaerae bacterium]|nr:ABC transporter ATP-binding protein [Lentisphaerota bacterium]
MTATASDCILELEHVQLSFGATRILRDVSLMIRRGEYCTLIGPNGAGKSTLLKCINGIYSQWRGRIVIAGEDARHCSRRAVARRVGYVPQHSGILPGYRVREFLLMSRYAQLSGWGGPGRDDREAVERAMQRTGIRALANRSLPTLSGGETQKVFIAAALVQATPILLLDEPTTFLDPRFQHEVNQLVVELNQREGITVLSVSHDLNSAIQYSDRLLAMKDGELRHSLDPRELMDSSALAELFDTRFCMLSHPRSGKPLIIPE